MSVIPHAQFSDLRPGDYLLRLVPQSMPAEAAHKPAVPHGGVDHVKAAEELSFGVAARSRPLGAEKDTATLAQTRSGRDLVRQAYRILRLRGVQAAFDQAFWHGEIDANAQRTLAVVRRSDGSPFDDADEDPFRRYVYLLEARRQVDPAEEPVVGRRLDDELDKLWLAHENEIVAGFNTARPMMRFAERVEEWDHFRSIYFAWVAHGEPLATTFKSLLEKFGPARLRAAINTLRDAIAADLASPIVCADKTRMQQQQIDLERNRTISSLMADTELFCRQLKADQPPMPEQVMNFVGGVLEYAAGPANERKFNALCAIVLPDDEVTEVLRGRVRQFLKKSLPLPLWSSAEARDSLFPPLFRNRN